MDPRVGGRGGKGGRGLHFNGWNIDILKIDKVSFIQKPVFPHNFVLTTKAILPSLTQLACDTRESVFSHAHTPPD